MKVNLENMHSPCERCYIRGHLYSNEDDICQRCEYNIAIYLLKHVLKSNDYCTLCKNRDRLDGGYFDCSLPNNNDYTCEVEKDFVIDWKAVFKEYDLDICCNEA